MGNDSTDGKKPPRVDIKEARAFFSRLREANPKKEGSDSAFKPFVMIRTHAGDRGIRLGPNDTFWESPDIWTAEGAPDATPDIPPNIGGRVTAGIPNTVYAHVWNLGRAPVAGAIVEWYWFNPSLGINGADANLIGKTRVDLSPRGFPGCHRLVKCPVAWVPVMENKGHECIVARVSAFGDPLNSEDSWDPKADRHVAQRNMTLLNSTSDLTQLMTSFERTRPNFSLVKLFQVGEEAAHPVALVAPQLRLDAAVKTQDLAQLTHTGALTLSPITTAPRIMPHMLLNLGSMPVARTLSAISAERPDLLHENADIQTMLQHGSLISPELMQRINVMPAPQKGTAQVLRVVASKDGVNVGGYTIIVGG